MFTHEMIRYEEKLPVKLYMQKIGEVPMHWHESMELLMVLSGSVHVSLGSKNYRLEAEDLILVNPYQMHSTQADEAVLVLLQISPSLFEHDLRGIEIQCCSANATHQEEFHRLRALLSRLVIQSSQEDESDEGVSLLARAYLYELMHHLITAFPQADSRNHSQSSDVLKRLVEITTYLSEHYREDISLKELARRQYLSAPYLSAFFEKNIGLTFTKYLTSLRLSSAYSELLSTDHLIDDIASANGFPNTRAFVSAFRKQYGALPSKYRALHAQAPLPQSEADDDHGLANYMHIPKNDYLAVLKKYTDAPLAPAAAKGVAIQARVDAAAPGQMLRHTFRTFTAVGRAKELLMAPVQAALRDLQAELHFTYIKFHGLLDDTMFVYQENPDGSPVYNFTYIDLVFDFLLSIGLRPLVQLSFLPKAMCREDTRTEFAEPVNIGAPKDPAKWEALVAALTQHLISRYGPREVQRWIFTYWNEPIGSTPFGFALSDVTDLYARTYRVIKGCDSGLCVASPSLLPELFDAELGQFLDYCVREDCVPDAYLFHSYQTALDADLFGLGDGGFLQKLSGHLHLTENPDETRRQVRYIRDYMAGYPARPTYLTEWNFSSSHRDWLNDTVYRSCFIVRNLLQNYDALESFGLWALSDLIEELPPSKAEFHGGMGLYTRRGLPKPVRLALGLLNRLKDRCIAQGEGYYVTTDGEGSYAIMLYHYVHYSPLYANGILFDASPDSRNDVFPHTGNAHIQLDLENMVPGDYRITESLVNREHGSVFDACQQMGGMDPDSEEALAYLKALARPALKCRRETLSTLWHYRASLQPHEVRLVELKLL